jgi:TetR/AcrR family transcriptional regulator, repressor of fatR-cypB operon
MNEYSFITPMTTAAENVSQDKRECILSAALQLFAEKGFYGTAVPEIAQKAGVAAGTIYRYFESKEAVANAVYQRHKGQLLAAVLDDFPYAGEARAQIHHFITRVIAFAKKQPDAFKFLELHHHAPYLDDGSRAVEANVIGMANAFVEQNERAKVLRKAPEGVLASIVWGGVVGLVRAAWEKRAELTHKTEVAFEEAIWAAIQRDDDVPSQRKTP